VLSLPDYLGHLQQTATDACSFVDGMGKDGERDDDHPGDKSC